MRFREKDKRGLRSSVAKRPKGKTQIITLLFVGIALTPGRRSDAECGFHSVGAFSGSSFRLVKRTKSKVFAYIRAHWRAGLYATQGLREDIEVFLRGGYTPREGAPPELVLLTKFVDKYT